MVARAGGGARPGRTRAGGCARAGAGPGAFLAAAMARPRARLAAPLGFRWRIPTRFMDLVPMRECDDGAHRWRSRWNVSLSGSPMTRCLPRALCVVLLPLYGSAMTRCSPSPFRVILLPAGAPRSIPPPTARSR